VSSKILAQSQIESSKISGGEAIARKNVKLPENNHVDTAKPFIIEKKKGA